MIDFSDARLDKLIVHKVGNKTNDEGIVFSKETLKLEGEMIEQLLLKFFLSPFKKDNYYKFYHESDVNLNETFLYSTKIFEDNDEFFEQSKNLATYLYERSTHPKINSGEFYTVIIKNCIINNQTVDAIGLFKTENKDTYLQIKEKDKNFEIDYESGININKLDKGCLIFNTEKENGYIVSMVDNINKSVVLSDEFDISQNAVKKAKRKYNNVIKLDKNFHVYVHGKQEFIEKGFDDDRDLNYYKLYFKNEK